MKNYLLVLALISIPSLIMPVLAQESENFGEGILEDPTIFHPEKRGFAFLLFIIGIAIYSLFIWYFYRFISKRDLFPKVFYGITYRNENESIAKIIGYASLYVLGFPVIIFAWFAVLTFFVFFISDNMPFNIAIFVSMAIIGVVRILSYYREDSAKEVAKNVPYAILGFLLTSAAVYANPNFFTEKNLQSIPMHFMENLEGIVAAILLISAFEFSFRMAFIIKRKFMPVADKNLEEEMEKEIDERLKVHYKKIEDKEKQLEKKLDDMMNKLKDSEK